MAGYCSVSLIGNVTRELELKTTGSGKPVVNFSLAINDGKKDDDATFVDVTAWEKTAEIASQYLTKGSQCFVEGRLRTESWEKEGQKRSKLVVICNRLVLLGKKGDAGGGEYAGEPGASAPASHSQPAFDAF